MVVRRFDGKDESPVENGDTIVVYDDSMAAQVLHSCLRSLYYRCDIKVARYIRLKADHLTLPEVEQRLQACEVSMAQQVIVPGQEHEWYLELWGASEKVLNEGVARLQQDKSCTVSVLSEAPEGLS
jgi:hypothetical protein